jgi:heme/copper-type cytochrome/quinol oxidase subunit 2
MDLIASTVPDQIFNRVKNNTTTMAMWTAIKAIYQTCLKMATIDLTQKLQSTKLQDKGDVRAHLTNLMNM